jgi:DNA-binding NarL/FixJ family response regulator
MAFRVLVADDHEVVRRGLCDLVASHGGWEVCGEAKDGREAVARVASLRPDVTILDIAMPNLNGLEATRQILKSDPGANILILTLHGTPQVIQDVVSAGARGFLLKSDAVRDLVTALEAIQEGKIYFTSRVASTVLDGYLHKDAPTADTPIARQLTAREREIVQLLAEGKTCRGVAEALGLSVKTAETHRSNIMRKLDLHSVSDLVIFAIRNNIVHVSDPEI